MVNTRFQECPTVNQRKRKKNIDYYTTIDKYYVKHFVLLTLSVEHSPSSLSLSTHKHKIFYLNIYWPSYRLNEHACIDDHVQMRCNKDDNCWTNKSTLSNITRQDQSLTKQNKKFNKYIRDWCISLSFDLNLEIYPSNYWLTKLSN